MTVVTSVWALMALTGCPEPEPVGCTSEQEVFAWSDEDADGYGVEPIGYVCTLGANQAGNNVDCDDSNPDINPGMEELCDLLDNDCNGAIDETHPKVPWYPDFDGDGYGDPSADAVESACQPPGPEWLAAAGDCDDTNAAINPLAQEICNDGIDDDCDRAADDADAGVDPLTFQVWHPDADMDSFGSNDPDLIIESCSPPAPGYTLDDQDCDDDNVNINPNGTEICNGKDDDCDMLKDDFDPDVDPATQTTFYEDADGDGYGHPTNTTLACRPDAATGAAANNVDCDDTDAGENIPKDWWIDSDGDRYADSETVVGYGCEQPGPNMAPSDFKLDCQPFDPTISPGEPEVCEDGIDQNCDDCDYPCTAPRTCDELLDYCFNAPSHAYVLEPIAGQQHELYCDMQTDGGGWTLVAASHFEPIKDQQIGYHGDLRGLYPNSIHFGVWGGLDSVITGNSDIRFACKDIVNDDFFTVDLSFYDVPWYGEITSGPDKDTCFLAGGNPSSPERRNNLTGVTLPLGDPYNSGTFEGEDVCDDENDFTVDFDDRGKDGNQSDGTDWGDDDGTEKCAISNTGQAWFIFVREP